MFYFRNNNLFPFRKKTLTKTVSHQINYVRSACGINNFVKMLSIYKTLNFGTSSLKGICSHLTEMMDPPMHIGVLMSMVMIHPVCNNGGHLAGCCVIQIDQRLAPDLFRQHREIAADPLKSHGWSRY